MSFDEQLFPLITGRNKIISNYNIAMLHLKYNFLRFNADHIKIKGGKWLYKDTGTDLTGLFLMRRVNIENQDRQKKLRSLIWHFNEEIKKLIDEYKEEDKAIFEKTGKNPDSIVDGKVFLQFHYSALPMIVGELE